MAQARRASRLAAVAGAALSVALASCGGGGADVLTTPSPYQEPLPTSGCDDIIAYPDEGRAHLAQGEKGSYRTQPPTSGKHAPSWGPTGTYAKPLSDEVQVHNLEHGHVVIQYVPGKISPALLDGLTKLVRTNERWALLAPRAPEKFVPSAPLAFTAWGLGESCPDPAPDALKQAEYFIEIRMKKGPETVLGRPIRETPPVR